MTNDIFNLNEILQAAYEMKQRCAERNPIVDFELLDALLDAPGARIYLENNEISQSQIDEYRGLAQGLYCAECRPSNFHLDGAIVESIKGIRDMDAQSAKQLLRFTLGSIEDNINLWYSADNGNALSYKSLYDRLCEIGLMRLAERADGWHDAEEEGDDYEEESDNPVQNGAALPETSVLPGPITICFRSGERHDRFISGAKTTIDDLRADLKGSIYGQDKAIDQIIETIRRSNIFNSGPTRATMMLLGPSGVGKSQTAKLLAEFMGYGHFVVSCNEMQQSHHIDSLLGAPPGYVDSNRTPRLIEHLKKRQDSVLVLDEIEKACPEFSSALMECFARGAIVSRNGHEASLRNSIVVMTTNVGTAGGGVAGFGSGAVDAETRYVAAAKKSFQKAFLGRIDRLISFDPLDKAALGQIIRSKKYETIIRANLNGIELGLSLSDKACAYIEGAANCSEHGARAVAKVYGKVVETPLASLAGKGLLEGNPVVRITSADGNGTRLTVNGKRIVYNNRE